MNKAGDTRGEKETIKSNFANDRELASRAGSKPKINLVQSITKSSVISSGGSRTNKSRITPEIQTFIRDELMDPDKKGTPYIHRFIKSFLDEAKKDPNSQAARYLANAIFKDSILETLDAELNKQMAKDAEFLNYRIRQTLYPKQQQVYDDNLSRTIECICTRRAGKTELIARLLVRECCKQPYITPTSKTLERNAIYLNRTFDNAVGQMGKPVVELLDKFDIKYDGSPGSGKITLENGNTITFAGYNNKGDIDKFRGFHYSMICCDECAHLRNPDVLMKETLEPALMDYGDEGRIILTGTPPRVKANYAYKQWHNPNITHYCWSFMDNPFIPNKEAIIETVCKEHGVTIDEPFIQREYFANLEAFDTSAMIFNGFKTYDKLPDKTWSHAWVGVDWGYEDKAAVIGCVADINTKQMYVIYCWSEAHKSISETCNKVIEAINFIKKLHLARQPWVICDSNDKQAVYELYQTYKIPNVATAYKYDRDMALEQLAEWCRTDKIFIENKDTAIKEDLENTIWARDDETDEIMHEISDEYHPNAAMALLYVSRQFAFDIMGDTSVKSAKDIIEG